MNELCRDLHEAVDALVARDERGLDEIDRASTKFEREARAMTPPPELRPDVAALWRSVDRQKAVIAAVERAEDARTQRQLVERLRAEQRTANAISRRLGLNECVSPTL